MNNKYNTLHYLIGMLKKYEIKNIVSSPGAQNSGFNGMVQADDYFNCYSVVDERSAAYVATGIVYESNAPAVITCTGATASRNYISAMTEAYYRKLPIVAITFFNPMTNNFSLSPQYVDRMITQNDIKYLSVQLPIINSDRDIHDCLLYLNAALSKALFEKKPVHINCPAHNDFCKNINSYPENLWKPEYYVRNFKEVSDVIKNKKTAIFIGSHMPFKKEEENAISEFAKSWNIPVFYDHTSNYHGLNGILISKAASMISLKENLPELILDIGGICGEYSSMTLFKNAELWRISKEETFKCRYNRSLSKMFACDEIDFFVELKNPNKEMLGYYDTIKKIINDVKIPNLPLCNAFICQQFAKYIPSGSSVHLSILNALRNLNFYELDSSISVNCNVGGFGIDGPLSTLLGQSLVNKHKKYFAIVGDLACFYDMNVLGQRNLGNNIRILLINNNGGLEFRLNDDMEENFGNDTGKLISAANHYVGGIKSWAIDCGFEYAIATTKEEFMNNIEKFCNCESVKPLLFEVKTNIKDEREGFKLMQTYNRNNIDIGLSTIYKNIKRVIK